MDYDDNFLTIEASNMEKPPENWVDLLTFSRENMVDEGDHPVLSDEWLTDAEKRSRTILRSPAESSPGPLKVQFEDPDEQQPSDDEEIPPATVDNDVSDEEDEEGDKDYWHPRNLYRGWVPNNQYFNERTSTTTRLDRALFNAMLDDFGLLTEEDAFMATLGTEEKPVLNSQL